MSDIRRKFNSVAEVMAAVEASGSHLFDDGTMDLGKSRIEQGVYGPRGRVFITTEQVPGYAGNPRGRYWTVRQVTENGSGQLSVDTVGNFMQFSTPSGARHAAQSYAEARDGADV